MLLQRLDNQAPRQHPDLPEPPSVTARRFYYDTVGHGSQAALLCAWKAFGADHLVAGSDYPVLMAFETYRQTFHYIRESSLPAADVDRILHHNSQILLGSAALDDGAFGENPVWRALLLVFIAASWMPLAFWPWPEPSWPS